MYSSAYVWARILSYLEEQFGAVVISTFFDDAEVVELNEDALILHTSTSYRRDIITQRYTSYIREALQERFQSNAKLVVLDDEEFEAHKSKVKKSTSMDFNPQFNFDNFVVGPSNRMAHSAAIAVSNHPGDVYNPLFIYGPPGVGKTVGRSYHEAVKGKLGIKIHGGLLFAFGIIGLHFLITKNHKLGV